MNPKIKKIGSVIAISVFLLQTTIAPAIAGISNLPPLVKPNVFPNIFYTLDDSGSMMFEHMPDSIAANSYTVGFPQPVGVYKKDESPASFVMPFGDDVGTHNAMSLKVARYRNSSVNPIYYNPATRYDTWLDSDGVPMPPAVASAARFNPVAPTGGALVPTIDLTSSNQAATQAVWGVKPRWERATTTAGVSEYRDFYPATYFKYIGGVGCGSPTTAANAACFERVEIKSATTSYPKSADRTDCAASTCTYDNEIQNFANWFQYWRSRMLMARGGTGIAFGKQTSNMRVGFGAINAPEKMINGVKSEVILNGVSNDFAGANRTAFYDQLYKYPNGSYGTPLRYATGKVGQYFKRTDFGGPWANTINDSSKGQATCRQNYHILMTDGYWTNANRGMTNVDNVDGGLMTAANGDTFQYTTTGTYYKPFGLSTIFTPGKQYADGHSDTLADAAMYYWKNDLRTDWDASKKNVPTNSRDPAFWQHVVMYTVGLGVTGTLNSPADLVGLTTGAKVWPDPVADDRHKVDDLWHAAVNGRGEYFSASNPKQFGSALSDALNDIAGRSGNAAAVGTSSNTVVSGTKLYMTTYNTQNWSGTIKQLNINSSGGIDAAHDWIVNESTVWTGRKIFTYKDGSTKGVEFNFSNLATSDQTFFTNAKTTLFDGLVTEDEIVDYLKGTQSREKNKTDGVFRVRTNLLGDIVGSSPQYVGQGENYGYQYLPATPTVTPGKETYFNFYSVIKKDRAARVYVGANDGMLHAFNATTGKEEFAYIPKTVLPNLPKLADPTYSHRFYVDGTPTIADAFIDDWKTVLVGTTGAGGRGVYALDITGTSAFDSSKILWEWNSSNDAEIGYTIGKAQVGRMPNGDWVAVFGNGYESASKKAMLFIANLKTGALTKVDTGAGGATPNGLATPRLVIDATGTITGAYAGDLLGNLWKFNFKPSGVSIAFAGAPLFQAKDGSTVQPITVQPDITPHPEGGTMVTFGTGKLFEVDDPSTTSTQTIYGIWDKTGIPSVLPTTVSSLSLVKQTLTSSASAGLMELSNEEVKWAIKRGWYINLSAGERVTIDPATVYNSVFYTTITPGSVTDPCLTSGTSMNLLFNAITGGAINSITFDTNKNGAVEATDVKASGMKVPLTFGSTILRRKGGIAIVQPGADGTIGGGGGGGAGGNPVPPADLPRIPALRLWRQILGKN